MVNLIKAVSSGILAALTEIIPITLAFDPSFTGQSGDKVRDVASPDIFTETGPAD